MAWNKPNSNTVNATSSSRPSGRGKMPRLRRGLLAGVIVVLGAGIAAWRLSNGEATSSSLQKKERGRIKEVTPAKARTNKVEAAKAEKKERPQRVGEVRDGKRLLSTGRYMTATPTVITSGVTKVSLIDRTFKNWTDRRLATVLDVEPGETFVGESKDYFRGFVKDFKKSLEEPVEYDKNDSQYVKELKIGVQQLRQELKERMESGEDIEKLMIDTREEWRELGLYRKELENQVVELTQDKGLSQEDYETLIESANKMLAERGSKPLSLPKLVKHRIRISKAKKAEETKNTNQGTKK